MVCWVDDMYKYPMGRYRGMKMSHMIADTEAELHAMADKIGVSRRWHQGNHYDIAMSKRELAVKYGAIAVTIRELARISRDQKKRHRHTRSSVSNNAVEGFIDPLEARKASPGTGVTRRRLSGLETSGES